MDTQTLRAVQAPLKERYRSDAETARTFVSARGAFVDPGVTATVEGHTGPVRAGLHRATGGDGSDACSADMLLEAVLACAGVTLRSVATAMGVPIQGGVLEADGWFDARGTLGVSREAPIGVNDIVVTATLDTPADDAALERLARSTERYCVVGQSLAQPPRFVVQRA